jgi:hypothetical protein
MTTIYIILTILITLIINASLSLAMPFMKIKWNALHQRIEPKKDTRTRIDCSVLESRIAILERKVYKRSMNQRNAIRQEIKNILTELKNK